MIPSNEGDEDEGAVVYAWENVTKKSWESVEEDERGNIVTKNLYNADKERLKRAKIHRTLSNKCVRRGLIRYLIVCMDCSVNAKETDYRPNRLEATKTMVGRFMREYFDQNPISQISLALTRDRVAEKLTDLSGNPKTHIHLLSKISRAEGAASLQNILHLAIATLKHVPQYGSREILIVYSSLTSCDPGNIFDTIEEVKKLKIKCSVICLSAEVYICRRLAEDTGGNFSVALDLAHCSELLLQHTTPLPEKVLAPKRAKTGDRKEAAESVTDFIYMGFPSRTFDAYPMLAYDGTGGVVVTSTSYLCPRCGARVTEIPTKCSVCSLQLNSSSHIARSHHHLFPVPLFVDCTPAEKGELRSNDIDTGGDESGCICFCCQDVLTEKNLSRKDKCIGIDNPVPGPSSAFKSGGSKMKLQCPRCRNKFCVECDIFIHDSLHNCPGCSLLE